jgi:hypothetical protein
MKILYNDYYGGFVFSNAFLAEYKARTGKSLNVVNELFHTGPKCIRCDPVAIAIFEERGAKWSSGETSDLAIYEIPDVFANYWEVDEYDGNETVRINVTEALADVLDTYMETRDHGAMERQYTIIKEACKGLAVNSRYGLRPDDMVPTSAATPPHLTVSDEDV